MELQVNGIYSKEIVDTITSLDIKAIAPDFRPKSFQFIQEYRAKEIIEYAETRSALKELSLIFTPQEHPLVVERLFATFSPLVSKLTLEFIGPPPFNRELKSISSQIPYRVSLESFSEAMSELAPGNCTGVLLSASLLQEKMSGSTISFEDFLRDVREQTRGLQMIFIGQIYERPPARVLEMISIERLHLEIGREVESAYQVCDIERMKKELLMQVKECLISA